MTPAMFTKLSFALLALPSLICPIFAAPAPLSCRSVITRICNTASNSPNSLENFFQSNSNILISHGLADEDPFQARLSLCGKDHGANTQWPEPSINGNSQSIPAFILMDRITKSGQNQESARAIVCYENPEDNTDDPSSKTSLLALQLAMVMALMACGLELVIITVNWRIARESRQQPNCDNKPASHCATCTLGCHLSQECLGPNTTNDTVYPPRTGLLGTETFYSDSEDEDDEISRPIM